MSMKQRVVYGLPPHEWHILTRPPQSPHLCEVEVLLNLVPREGPIVLPEKTGTGGIKGQGSEIKSDAVF